MKKITVYGVFGDDARTDADNIYSLHTSIEKAKIEIESANKDSKWTTYHLEVLELLIDNEGEK